MRNGVKNLQKKLIPPITNKISFKQSISQLNEIIKLEISKIKQIKEVYNLQNIVTQLKSRYLHTLILSGICL